ncbi:cyclase family protein [Sciscionella marina]|uniref:cyclase family protein n=1 Tax=Sciscionella marina TaxID=508770 RepID=UPI000377B112|nr:cyclase family protein [Sciscionella marina]
MRIIDISSPISEDSVSWHDRFPTEVTWHSRTSAGERTTNSTWRLHVHTGTHVDAPVHHLAGGQTVDELELTDFLGPCRVLDLRDARGQIGPTELATHGPRAGERLLLRTANSERGLLAESRFTEDYIGISAEGARYLAQAGVRLVGVDFLSVEAAGAPGAETHHILLGGGIRVLEGLALSGAVGGEYELLFLPLPLVGADAAPGRAVLLEPGCSPTPQTTESTKP